MKPHKKKQPPIRRWMGCQSSRPRSGGARALPSNVRTGQAGRVHSGWNLTANRQHRSKGNYTLAQVPHKQQNPQKHTRLPVNDVDGC